ncbi:MAG: GTPase [Ardenticatenaceae bacterium]|nr:GTPase [Ardenticatenaceae bacterium]
MSPKKQRILIAGAAGRDFHDFNTLFRQNDTYEVVAFTATQIPNIEGRKYPPTLSGPLYPEGIPIYPENRIEQLIRDLKVDQVTFSYSDVSHEYVMHLASRVLAAGADFRLVSPHHTMLQSDKPIVSVCAVRTGCGKSQTARRVVQILQELGYEKVIAVRHPMPYGHLAAQAVQRFATYEDMDKHDCTIEEREEYEPYVDMGAVIYAGVDYAAILHEAEQEADVIIWDGGNNDVPFFAPDFHLVVVDPHRPGHELLYHPGETNLRMATAVLINKVDTADYANILQVQQNIQAANPNAVVLQGASPVLVDEPTAVRGKRVLVVEDGPTLTHGEMTYGAGIIAARALGAAEIIDPRPYAVRSIAATFAKYPGTGPLLPAMGYGGDQIADLEETINNTPADLVLIATPIDLGRLIKIRKPWQRVRYSLQEIGQPTLKEVLQAKLTV